MAELNSYFLNMSTILKNIDDDGKQQHKTSTQSSLDKLGEISFKYGRWLVIDADIFHGSFQRMPPPSIVFSETDITSL